MSSKYIVRIPIKDAQSKIVGYDVQYHGENSAFGSGTTGASSPEDFVAADTIYGFLTQNQDKHFSGTLNFMTFTSALLIKKTPLLFDVSDLVIQINDSVLIHPLAMHMVRQYSKSGYKIAVNEFEFTQRYMAFINDIDYICLDAKSTSAQTIDHILETANSMNKKCIACGVDTKNLYEEVKEKPFYAFKGNYVAKQIASKTHSSDFLQTNFFRLMVAVTKEEPDIEEIEQIISFDATLTYGILKMVNSVHFALRKRVTNVRQAIMTIGLNEMKQWVYLLSATNGDTDNADEASQEFLRLSFMRASFCSRIVDYVKKSKIKRADAYLLGMLSTLNYLIDMPMVEILDEIPVIQEIKDALLEKEGVLGNIFELILCYEQANWKRIDEIAEELSISTDILTNLYFSCVEEALRIWTDITSPMEQPVLTV